MYIYIYCLSARFKQQGARILLESSLLMYLPPSIIRKRFVSLLFLLHYTNAADDFGLQSVYQDDSLAPSSATLEDNSLLAFSGLQQFTTPFTGSIISSIASSKPATTDPNGPHSVLPENNDNDPLPGPLLLSNEDCQQNEQAYPPSRQRRRRRRHKRQNEKTFCENPSSSSYQLDNNNNGKKSPNTTPTQNSAPNPNGRYKIPNKAPAPPPLNERLHGFLYSIPGWDGKPDPTVCNKPEYPLLQVPVCAPPVPPEISRISPADFVVPCKFG